MRRLVASALLAFVLTNAAHGDDDAVQRRVRELIYMLRQHRVVERADEWASAIRELTEIGPAAVPELVRELETTDRDATLRALGFALRAIGDPRAVPHLIRAIPKALRPPGSDYGMAVADPDLFAFMKLYDRSPDDGDSFSYGRPVNEILDTLEKLTGHREPPGGGQNDDLRHIFLGGSDIEQAAQRKRFDDRMRAWQDWWGNNWRQFATQQQLATVAIVPRDEDLVARDGLAKFGLLFPTGPGVRLGPVHDIVLESANYWDGKSHIDFDTGRLYEYLEQFEGRDKLKESAFGVQINAWYQQHGIDARNFGSVEGQDLFVWLVDDDRWETIEDEISVPGELRLGREASSYLVPFGGSRNDFQWERGGVFLITTREGGRGIVKTFPPDKPSQSRRLQYRMFIIAGSDPPKGTDAPAEAPRTPLSKAKQITLPAPGVEVEYLLGLETGRRFALPDGAEPEAPGELPVAQTNESLRDWRRAQGIDLASSVSSGVIAFAGGKPPPPPKNRMQLVGFEMTALRVSGKAFERMSVERVGEIMDRAIGERGDLAWMALWPADAPEPYTWAIRTREGRVGLLQIVKTSNDPQTITFRYRLADAGDDERTK